MPEPAKGGPAEYFERVGRSSVAGVEQFGYGAELFRQAVYWLFMGRLRRQRVRAAPIFAEAYEAGIRAILEKLSAETGWEIISDNGLPIGLKGDGASVSLEPGILVAGRSGSALAARVATMTISQEVDALRSMGVDPVRFLVVPPLVAMMIMVPTLVFMAEFVALLGAGLYISPTIDITMAAYLDQVIASIDVDDVMHGISKSVIFGILITIVGIVDGSSVTGGAEGVGRVTTSSVVHGISAIVLTDMIFVYAATR